MSVSSDNEIWLHFNNLEDKEKFLEKQQKDLLLGEKATSPTFDLLNELVPKVNGSKELFLSTDSRWIINASIAEVCKEYHCDADMISGCNDANYLCRMSIHDGLVTYDEYDADSLAKYELEALKKEYPNEDNLDDEDYEEYLYEMFDVINLFKFIPKHPESLEKDKHIEKMPVDQYIEKYREHWGD